MIVHHPPRELLLDYAAGAVSEGVSLIIASHLSMCARCAAEADALNDLGGILLCAECPAETSEEALQTLLSRLDEPEPPTVALPALDAETRATIPPPLRRYLPASLGALPWRSVGRLYDEVRLPLAGRGMKASLMRLRPGSLMPKHSHQGNEMTLVLEGGFTDGDQNFRRGDFDAKDASDLHQPRVDDDGSCLCLAVLDAPVRLTGVVGRLINPFLRI
jgi:putative transcriptional regulator